jgi:hypothetical protein
MALDVTTILQFVLLLICNCLCDTPANQKHSLFAQIITSNITLEEIASATSLVFASGLFDTLQAAVPPTMAFFKTLPTNYDKQWVCTLYCLGSQAVGRGFILAQELVDYLISLHGFQNINELYTCLDSSKEL